MITLRPAAERGHAGHGWLESWHSFSFAGYVDPAHVHWGPLRVINEDRVQPGRGFGTHAHDNMEIISYVLEGALAHRDSLGTGATILPGEVQRMSAGTGVSHSEYNAADGVTHFLQIWIIPSRRGIAPGYEQKAFPAEDRRGRLQLLASGDAREGSLRIHQDARLYAGLFDGDQSDTVALAPGRLGYVHMARGRAVVDGHRLGPGDALLYADEPEIRIGEGDGAEVLVFDLPRMP